MSTSYPSDRLPVLAVVLDSPLREFSLLAYMEAAAGVCRPVWVTLRDDPETVKYTRVLRRSGAVIDAYGKSPADVADRLREQAPDGILTFTESDIPWTAELAEILGVPYHSRATASRLSDKWEQRAALRAQGLATPGFWDLGALAADDDALRAVVESATFPLIVKPRVGRASRDMERIDDAHRLEELAARSWPEPMVVEEFIPDPSHPQTGEGNAFYVSVEVVMSQGTASVLGVSGRHPLEDGFREAGLFFPAEVPDDLRRTLAETAVAATRAVGVENGVLHIEVKTTDAGPVVIELNPRPGGSALPDLLHHAFGIAIFEVAMRVAVGEHVVYDDLPEPSDVGYSVYVMPPLGLRHITAVEGLDTLGRIEGVEAVIPKRVAGDDVDPHAGMMEYVVRVSGTAPDHNARRRVRQRILAQVTVHGDA